MSGIPKWGRSSQRRLRLIRWKRWEIVSAIVLAFIISLLCLAVAQFLATHPFD